MTGTVPTGQVLADDFRILRQIGFGGYARVYLAEQLSVGRRKVAVKILHAVHVQEAGDSAIADLKREASYLAMLRAPCFPRVIRTGIAPDGRPFFVMEFIAGRNLETQIRESGPLGIDQAVAVIEDICEGLGEMHSRDILHRDLKPGNVVLEDIPGGGQRANLLDLGSAKPIYEPDPAPETGKSLEKGSPPYLAPEIATTGRFSERSDIYGLGAVAYEIFAGIRALHLSDTSPESFVRYLRGNGPIPTYPIGTLQPEVPEEIDAVVARALSRDPAKRHGSVSEFRADLVRAAYGFPERNGRSATDRLRHRLPLLFKKA